MKCCFIGHRNTEITEKIKEKLKETIEELVINKNVKIFLFGSRSNFNSLCYSIVTRLKEKYKDIKRVAYTCKSETCLLVSEKEKWRELYSLINVEDNIYFEEEYEHKTKYKAGRSSYIERNYAMIESSDYCVFYYDESYKPEIRRYSKKSSGYYQPRSGTYLAYIYAKQKKKTIINLLNV